MVAHTLFLLLIILVALAVEVALRMMLLFHVCQGLCGTIVLLLKLEPESNREVHYSSFKQDVQDGHCFNYATVN